MQNQQGVVSQICSLIIQEVEPGGSWDQTEQHTEILSKVKKEGRERERTKIRKNAQVKR
jgi:hypothetical protein